MNSNTDIKNINDRSWEKIIMKYNQADWRKSVWQIVNTFVPYVLLWYLMVMSLQYSYWITLFLSFITAGFTIRLFIIFHDCGHGSFFKSKKVNDVVGKILGVIVFTPYSPWHYSHRLHHSTAGNLDKRGYGDVWTLTVEEYQSASRLERLKYRLYRSPWIMFTLGTVLMLLIKNRFTRKTMAPKDKLNVYFTNIMLILVGLLMCFWIGVKTYLLVQLPVIFISNSIGIWLFYVQHQFDEVYWDESKEWDYKSAAIQGSSFLKLPVILQWFTGSIGFHHIHHLSPRIPNYNLARCHYENDFFKDIEPITLWSSTRALKLRLWDKVSRRMISFRQMSSMRKAMA